MCRAEDCYSMDYGRDLHFTFARMFRETDFEYSADCILGAKNIENTPGVINSSMNFNSFCTVTEGDQVQ